MSDQSSASAGISHARALPALPADIDPRTINDDVLREHGLPCRPDPQLQPHLFRQWNRIMARPTRFIQADLAIDNVMNQRHQRREAFDPTGWGGVVKEQDVYGAYGTQYTKPATMVFGEWVVPEVFSVAPEGSDLTIGFWVGLDGYNGAGGDLLQAGVAATVKPGWWSSSVEYWAWAEWYTGQYQSPPVKVQNFPVRPGDTMSVLVTANGPGSGTAFMRNGRTGLGTSVAICQPKNIVSVGGTIEWVVEATDQYIPLFEPVTFTNCWGASLIEGASEFFSLLPGRIDTPSIQGWLLGNTSNWGDLTATNVISPSVAQVSEVATDWG
jgi:Peptidase A4 family